MVHSYKLRGYNILLDVNSGLVHVASDVVYELVNMINADIEAGVLPAFYCLPDYSVYKDTLYDRFNAADVDEACDEVKELIENRMLYTEDVYVDHIESLNNFKTNIKAMCLHVAHDCNLACKYCFADEGEYKGERSLMSLEVGKKAIDLLIENSKGRKNLEIDFFGGEPLMNFDVVKGIVAYARGLEKEFDKNFRFTLTTNAVLLDDEITEFLNREMSNVVLSLDGRKEVNDEMRVTRNGKGSYDAVVPNISRFIKKRGDKDHYVRGTFTNKNLDFSKDVEEYLALGYTNLSLEPVVTDKEYGIRYEDLDKIMSEYERLADLYLEKDYEGKPFTFFHFMIDLDQGPCVIKRLKGCGSGTEYVAVTPEGKLYPCHQFVGEEGFEIGDVYSGIVDKENIIQKFRQATLYSKDKCDKCFAKFYCSGGCPANSYNFSKDINKVYDIGCEMQKKRVECAIMIQVALAERGN